MDGFYLIALLLITIIILGVIFFADREDKKTTPTLKGGPGEGPGGHPLSGRQNDITRGGPGEGPGGHPLSGRQTDITPGGPGEGPGGHP
jgi:hypothetical protein